jgi:hypothetical protein
MQAMYTFPVGEFFKYCTTRNEGRPTSQCTFAFSGVTTLWWFAPGTSTSNVVGLNDAVVANETIVSVESIKSTFSGRWDPEIFGVAGRIL